MRLSSQTKTLRLVAVGVLGCMPLMLGAACNWNPTRPFERNAPEVDKAISVLDAGDASAAAQVLQTYLATGACSESNIGTPDRVRDKPNGSFDLGIALFHIAEQFGRRFGEEDPTTDAGPTPEQQTASQLRSDQAECALKVVRAASNAPGLSPEFSARARYLEGNLEFLRRGYQAAVKAYDDALRIIPGLAGDAGDSIGRDAAWNRAIALQRIEDEKKRDAGPDSPSDAPPDSPQDAPKDQGDDHSDAPDDSSKDSAPDSTQPDGGKEPDAGKNGDSGNDAGGPDGSNQDQQDSGGPDTGSQPPPPNSAQDDRVLDMLESAPTVQLQDAKNRANQRKVRGGMVDK